jgi:hypothetical protein
VTRWGRQETADELLQKELQRERAGALVRAIEALEGAIRELVRFDQVPAPPGAVARWAQRRADLVADAAERLWYVVIQREALGVTRHEVLYEVLEVPGEVRRRMGPRRRTGT